MSGEVQFEDENYSIPGNSLRQMYQEKLGFLENVVIKTGIVSTREGAKKVLIGVICFCVLIMIFISVYAFGSKNQKIPRDALEIMKRTSQVNY